MNKNGILSANQDKGLDKSGKYARRILFCFQDITTKATVSKKMIKILPWLCESNRVD